jgi:hypothetical protein
VPIGGIEEGGIIVNGSFASAVWIAFNATGPDKLDDIVARRPNGKLDLPLSDDADAEGTADIRATDAKRLGTCEKKLVHGIWRCEEVPGRRSAHPFAAGRICHDYRSERLTNQPDKLIIRGDGMGNCWGAPNGCELKFPFNRKPGDVHPFNASTIAPAVTISRRTMLCHFRTLHANTRPLRALSKAAQAILQSAGDEPVGLTIVGGFAAAPDFAPK